MKHVNKNDITDIADFTEYVHKHPLIASGDIIVDTWTTNDILSMQGPHGPWPLSKEDAKNILYLLKTSYAGELGINWENVETAISDYLQDNPPQLLRADVAIGTADAPNARTGAWRIEQFSLPEHELKNTTDMTRSSIAEAFQVHAERELTERNEPFTFIRTIRWSNHPLEEEYPWAP